MDNFTMLADYYEFTMMNGYFEAGRENEIAIFDLFFREVPDGSGFAIMAGVEQLVDYLENLKFTDEDIDFFKKKGIFGEKFLSFLKDFHFTSDVWAVPEGTPIFPHEPILTVRGPVVEVQLIETMALLTINHQSLIASKANRIVRAAEGRPVMEFGSRRAQGTHAANLGARAAFIGGVVGSANTMVDRDYGVPAMGTMAHSWVQLFPSEYEAFKAYCETYPDQATLLIDTYDTLDEGLPNAIRAFREVLIPKGFRPKGVRIDSGDLSYLTKKVRKVLDREGFSDCSIVVSGGLDEYVIRDLLVQGAKIDSFGVGERLITSKTEPVFGGVYKLSGIDNDGVIEPKIKISENTEKITVPGYKKVLRFFDKNTGDAMADLCMMRDEENPDGSAVEIFHPIHTWKKTTLENYEVKELLVPIYKGGKLVYKLPSLMDIRKKCEDEVGHLWDEVKRFENPHRYYVDLSPKLWEVRNRLLSEHK